MASLPGTAPHPWLVHAVDRCEPAPLSCRVLDSSRDWDLVRPWWNELLERTPDATPWQSWDYLSLWWRALGDGKELRIVLVEREGRPCLAMPLQISRRFEMIGMPVCMIEPVGMIMDVNRPRLAIGPFDPDAYRCALDALWQRRREWDLVRIDEKQSGDDEVAILKGFAAERGLWYRDIFSHLCPYLDLRQDWTAYLESRSRRLRRNLRAGRRKLEARGVISLREHRSPEEIEAGYAIVLELHRRSWKAGKRIEQSQSDAYRRFFRTWLQRLAEQGRARILVLYCGRQPVAATIGVTAGQAYYSAQIVHDARFDVASPGTLLESMELEALMRDGSHATYDFLGAFLNNKLRWTDTARSTSLVFVLRRSLRTLLIDGYYFRAKPWVKGRLRRFARGARQATTGAPSDRGRGDQRIPQRASRRLSGGLTTK